MFINKKEFNPKYEYLYEEDYYGINRLPSDILINSKTHRNIKQNKVKQKIKSLFKR